MMTGIQTEHLAALASLLKERVGLHVKMDGFTALRLAMSARMETTPSTDTADSYLDLLRSEGGDDEMRRLLPLVTVGKTSFFRDENQFEALPLLLDDLLRQKRKTGAHLAIWSAGCATGEEPYSLAMVAAEAGIYPHELELLATDVNPEAVAATSLGRFAEKRVRDMQPELLARYFEPDTDGTYRAQAHLRERLTSIRVHNLNSGVFPRPTTGEGWDVIFCRNVIIYFDTPTAQQVLSRFYSLLRPHGYLFLGYSESLFRLFEGFELVEMGGAFIYRRPKEAFAPGASPPPSNPAHHTARYTPATVTHLSQKPSPRAHPVELVSLSVVRVAKSLVPQEELDRAVGLLETGQFEPALSLLETLVNQGATELAVRLTLANVYGILRAPERATECYQAALADEPLSAEAHLFFGIHLLSDGDPDGAALELSRALFLDPDLALGHYYLGRCREKQKDVVRARLAYKNAMEAYRREPRGRRQDFQGYYPDLPEDGSSFARAAEYALASL